jgi:hypothetical protein
VGVVELPEGIRIITRLTVSDPAGLALGQAMELRVVPLHTDADGNEVVTYSFAPVDEPGPVDRPSPVDKPSPVEAP